MESTRLPGKVLADVCGKPMLHYVITRARQAMMLDEVVIATSTQPSDDPIERFCREMLTPVFRGSQDDVLDRYYQAAMRFDASVIVRLTADCPLLDPRVIDRVVEHFRTGSYDYVSNVVECTFPDGLDTEVFRREALERAWREARLPSEREHVTPYIHKHPELFALGGVTNAVDLSGMRWTVDEPRDLDFVRAVYERAGSEMISTEEIVNLLQESPDIAKLNEGIDRNEGILKSLREDLLAQQQET